LTFRPWGEGKLEPQVGGPLAKRGLKITVAI